MYKLARQFTPETTDPGFDCRATAGLLRSVGTLVWASHAVALIAVIGYHAWIPLSAWALVLYFGVRARLDAELLELLASDPREAATRLDHWLLRAKLRLSVPVDRDIADRCRGARRIARNLLAAFVLQSVSLVVIIVRESA